jgi:glycine oxidase
MRVRILGAGIIGLFCADELVSRGHAVRVVDPRPAAGALFVTAGMLSPSAEACHGEGQC